MCISSPSRWARPRVGHPIRLEHRQSKQLVGGRRRKGSVLLGGQRRQPVSGLRRDDDAGAAARDDIAELLEHERGAIQIDGEDRCRRGLRRRNTRSVDHAGYVAKRGGLLHERADRLARRHVDGHSTDPETGIAKDLRRRVSGFKT